MSSVEVKDDRKYSQDHEWLKPEGANAKVGISAFAVDQLGDITLVDFNVKPGDSVSAGQVFGTIESVKTLSDLLSPVSGTVVALNTELEEKPELVNDDCWEAGWIISVEVSSEANLMDAAAYTKFLEESDH